MTFRASQFVVTAEMLGSHDRVVLQAQIRRAGLKPLPFPDCHTSFLRLDVVLEWARANRLMGFLPRFELGERRGRRGVERHDADD